MEGTLPPNNRRLIALVVLLGLVVGGAGAILYLKEYYRPESVAEVGRPFPSLTLSDVNGVPVEFKALRGRRLLATFVTLDCWNCLAQIAVLEKLRCEFDEKLAMVIVSTDSRAKTKVFFEENPVSIPVWVDSGRDFFKKLGPFRVPAMFLLAEDGILRHIAVGYRSFGDTHKIVSSWLNDDDVLSSKARFQRQ